jgi:2-keto-3-deoxy-6-phosphogluconate aldolase
MPKTTVPPPSISNVIIGTAWVAFIYAILALAALCVGVGGWLRPRRTSKPITVLRTKRPF